jgi:hypothetical protein
VSWRLVSGALVSSASVSVPSAGRFNLFATGVAVSVAAAAVPAAPPPLPAFSPAPPIALRVGAHPRNLIPCLVASLLTSVALRPVPARKCEGSSLLISSTVNLGAGADAFPASSLVGVPA